MIGYLDNPALALRFEYGKSHFTHHFAFTALFGRTSKPKIG